MKIYFLLLFSLLSCLLFSQEIEYKLSTSKPQNHYFEVEMTLKNFKDKSLDLKMPVWAPGSYLIREFAKNVNLVKAFDEKGNPLSVKKTTKNTWNIVRGKAKEIKINYEVYAFELSVRTSFLDQTHGFVSGSGVFMYINNYKNKSGKLNIDLHDNFSKISTGLAFIEKKNNIHSYQFNDYDQLADCPIEIGNQHIFNFKASGVNHIVAMYGDANYDENQLKVDMAKIIEAETKVFGENPNKEYTFIIHNVVDGQGGLEHCNSTTLSVNRWTYQGSAYLGFLSLVAHEYFHLWNVKRMRPIELGPFNYDQENYTSLLWVMEGFTSYYDELILRRAGFYTDEQMLGKVQSIINYVEATPGSRVQPLSHSSYDAWIKAYRPNENSANTTMSYYSRGQLMAAVFDAKIIAKYNGQKCLDDFMKLMYNKYYKKLNRGFTDGEFKKEFESFIDEDLTDFYKKYIDGTEILPYQEIYGNIGIDVQDLSTNKVSFGATFKESNGKIIVTSIKAGSSAENAGLSVNDEIISYNGFKITKSSLESNFNELAENDEASLLIFRDEQLLAIEVVMTSISSPQFQLKLNPSSPKYTLSQYWLRSDK